ncbi:MAG: Crp/Fnr family transcriptional regulator [Halobacteriovoraceae bacterium]|nr:Crp/Fnr family transcriptional regulator [Halobacteriovoraceae bacterium]
MIKYQLLHSALSEMASIPKEEWEHLVANVEELHLNKGDFYLREGEGSPKIGFIITGFCRQFFTDSTGTEFNHNFNFENELVAGYQAHLEKRPSDYSIQAMENTELLTMSWESFEGFYERHSCWERIGRRAAEYNYLIKIQRERAFLTRDATQRYQEVLQTLPEIPKRVPQYHIASYLGITASALNRIIKKLEKDS